MAIIRELFLLCSWYSSVLPISNQICIAHTILDIICYLLCRAFVNLISDSDTDDEDVRRALQESLMPQNR